MVTSNVLVYKLYFEYLDIVNMLRRKQILFFKLDVSAFVSSYCFPSTPTFFKRIFRVNFKIKNRSKLLSKLANDAELGELS